MNNADKFLKLALEKKMAPFYLISTPLDQHNGELLAEKWFHHFWQNYHLNLTQLPYQDINNHPDVLSISTEAQNLKMQDFEGLTFFKETNPISLPYKFCLINSSKKISAAISNKLLKILEEPGQKLVIILFHDGSSHLLPTILSRAIHLRLTKNDLQLFGLSSHPKIEMEESLNEKSFSELFKNLKNAQEWQEFFNKNKEHEKLYFQLFFQLTKKKIQNFKEADRLIEFSKWYQESKLYHNSISERAIFIYQYMKSIDK